MAVLSYEGSEDRVEQGVANGCMYIMECENEIFFNTYRTPLCFDDVISVLLERY
jgi:hypothetical protein